MLLGPPHLPFINPPTSNIGLWLIVKGYFTDSVNTKKKIFQFQNNKWTFVGNLLGDKHVTCISLFNPYSKSISGNHCFMEEMRHKNSVIIFQRHGAAEVELGLSLSDSKAPYSPLNDAASRRPPGLLGQEV